MVYNSLIDYFKYNKSYSKKGTVGGEFDDIVDKNSKDSIDLSIGANNNDNIIGEYRKELQKVLRIRKLYRQRYLENEMVLSREKLEC